MAVISQGVEQVTSLLHGMKLESHSTTGDKLEVSSSFIGDTSEANPQPPTSIGFTDMPLRAYNGGFDLGAYYSANAAGISHGFYYGGYDYPIGDWDDYSQHVGIGLELQGPGNDFNGIYNENGSILYNGTSYGYIQPIYCPYTPGIPVSANSQLYSTSVYPYSGHIYPMPLSGPVVSSALPFSGNELTSIVDSNKAIVDGLNGPAPLGPRPPHHDTALPTSGPFIPPPSAGPNFATREGSSGNDGPGLCAAFPDGSGMMDGQQMQCISQPFPGQAIHSVPGQIYTGSTPARAPGILVSGFEPRRNSCGWVVVDKGRMHARNVGPFCNGNGNLDILNEQNRGPRVTRIRNQRAQPGSFRVINGQDSPNGYFDGLNSSTIKEQYNRSDFSTVYENAKFFIIKSYSEDDIHKSIKYNVWASTPNGNKKLDAAYQEAQVQTAKCPMFLFFSVNASGQFCGVAEMVGPVDFNQSMDFWQQDKWNGKFPVKWHIIKDVPNNQFRHIILANNDNKPVTNSRDTQEVNFEQGVEVLKLFKNYVFKTSILDDFQFYEDRQKAMQEKKAMQRFHAHSQQAEEASVNRTSIRSTHEEVPCKPQDVRLKIEGGGDESVTRSKDSQLGSVSRKVAFCNGGEFKLLLRPVEKGGSPAESVTVSEHLKSSSDSKESSSDHTKHSSETKSALLTDREATSSSTVSV